MCEQILSALALGAFTYLWLWYLTWEAEHYKNPQRKLGWWSTDIKDLIRRNK